MNTKVRTSLLALAVVAGSAAMASYYGASFDYSPKVGDVARYRSVAKFTMMGADGTATFVDRQKITSVEDDLFTLESATESFVIEVMGQEMPMENMVGTIKMKRNGVIVSMEGNESFGDMRNANLSAFIRPDKEIEQGGTWTHKFAADTKTGVVAAEVTYKFVGEENMLGEACNKVEFSYKETEGSTPASNSGTLWISKANGQLVKSVSNWKNVMVPGSPEPMNAEVTTERLK